MTVAPYKPLLHRYAFSTGCMAMVTLVFGALTTSKNAGMAFRDWPNSDGYLMVTYPWFRDFASNWDKFLEHGHRLAGMLIGLWSIGLVVLIHRGESRRWVVGLAYAVLGCVIVQGLLGGFRVVLDERGLAMVHGFFAACVLSLMATVSTVESRGWLDSESYARGPATGHLKPWAVLTVVAIAGQFLLGGMIRHHGSGLHEHLGMGILTWGLILANTFVSQRSGVRWIRRSGWMLLAVASLQVVLGAGAWVLKWGFPWTGYVATADSIAQVLHRTAHAVVGMQTLAAAAVHLVRVFRVSACCPQPVWNPPAFLPSPGGTR